jgi:mRNA interferase MazF
MSYRRGEVVLVLFPNSDLTTAKRRPALIVQADNLATGIGQTVLALITSNMARAGHPSRILVPLGSPAAAQAGFRTDSVIMTDDLVTVSDTLILRTIGTFPDMHAIDAALKHTLALA